MAEVQEVIDDHNFTMQQLETHEDQEVMEEKLILNSTEGLNVGGNNPTDLMEIDEVTIVNEELQEPKIIVESEKTSNISNTNEDGNVESPTTGDGFVYKCVFCDKILSASDEPKLLECLHNACGNCVNNKLYEQSVHCPNTKPSIECGSCNLVCESDKLIENQFLLELSSAEDNGNLKAADIKCSNCPDDVIANSFCVDCSEYICESCVLAHQRLKITKDHTIKSKEEGYLENHSGTNGTSSTTLHCNIHPHEKLSLFCENCDKLTCRDCQLIEHRDHKYKFTHEIASDTRKFIAAMLKDVSYKRVLLNSAMKVIDDRQNLITDKKQALVQEITQLVVKLTNTINVRGKQLVSRLTEVCEQKQKTLQEKRIALDQLSKTTDHCIAFTQHALDNGSDMALLFSKKQVTSHLQRIKCKRADIPNPEIPVRIHLALDKVPELIKVISTIGQIVVDGRVYPTPSTSPATSLPSHGSPSPVHTRPPQQQSPLNQQQSNMPGFQHPRLPPPYSQYQTQNMITNPLRPNLNENHPSGLNSNMIPSIPMSLAQHLQQNLKKIPIQRNSMGRPIIPMSRMTTAGINHQQQQVSSSTHPQGLMQERGNLRGLLQTNNNPVYVQTGPSQYQAVQPQFVQQYQSRYAASQQLQHIRQQAAIIAQNQQQQQQQQQHHQPQQHQQQQPHHQPQQQQQQHHQQQQQHQQYRMPVQRVTTPNHGLQSPPTQNAKWHIPQHNVAMDHMTNLNNNMNINRNQVIPNMNNNNFKITLKAQNQIEPKPTAVSSTIPKTPSPNHIQGKSDTERNLDKYCQDSVNDLMATIAKLDSNGVQVLAEGRQKTGGSPHVDSSTDDLTGPSRQIKTDTSDIGKDDPNEDWCAVCMDGGELVCCDKCPKVFHQFCHIPNLSVEESDTWQCLLCINFADIPEVPVAEQKPGELSPKDRKIAERLVLELYCQYEPSLPFREIIGIENTDYHSVIKTPIALDTIRHKLDWSVDGHYTDMEDLVRDVRLMFKNAYTFNEEGTQVYNDARTLEKFFDEQLEKFLPHLAYNSYDYDDVQPPTKRYKRIITD